MKIAFMRGNTFWSRLIRLWTRGQYSHCEVMFSDGSWFGCEPTGDKKTSFHRYYTMQGWDFIDIPLTQEEEESLKEWGKGEVGCGYDWFGLIFSQIFFWDRNDLNRWFCSEICAVMCQRVNKLPVPPKAVRYAPSGPRGGLYEALLALGFKKDKPIV